jgi:acetate kinase
MKVAVINCGSSSIKYEVFDARDCHMLATGLIEKIGSNNGRLWQRRLKADGTFEEKTSTKRLTDHHAGFEIMESVNLNDPIIGNDAELFGIGHRVVHGGEAFREPALINSEVIAAIRGLIPLAPLHNPSNLLGIEAAQERFPRVPQVAVFDTAFHQTLPPPAYHYALPHELYEKYHVLHLGNGASAAAVQGGRSVDTSLGMTPLEGLVMGTRCGDIDPSIPFYLMRKTGMTPDEVESLLNRESGLKGICDVSDMREILKLAADGNERAELAIQMFCYRVKKYVGAYHAVLGRLDAIVFTGGIGENAAAIRRRICEGLKHLGIGVSPDKNNTAKGTVTEIQQDGLPVKVLVIRTNEELEIAQQTISAINKAKGRP